MPDSPAAIAPADRSLSSDRRISLAEFLIGTFIVIGHNVFHIVPNEVPILFVFFWISFRLREGTWRPVMFARPASWPKTVLVAVIAAAILVLGKELVVLPLAQKLWPAPEHASSVLSAPVLGWRLALRNLALVWIFAALGEEAGYRGYLMTRAADLGRRSKAAYMAAMICVAVLFGFGHFYQGPAGVVGSTYSGLVLGSVCLLTGRNLWASILTHGIADTVVVVVIFAGWAT